jgi:hypothetical protein
MESMIKPRRHFLTQQRSMPLEPASAGDAPGIEAEGRDAAGGSVYESPARGLARAGAILPGIYECSD